MEPISTVLTAAAGYVLKAVSESKTAQTAKESLLSAFWQWIRPVFLTDEPDEAEIVKTIVEKIKDEAFFKELQSKVEALQTAGIKEKNIVKKDIMRVKKIKIGDKEYNPDETYDRKNIVEGNISDADEFTLGDGH
jgi:hypothetical protein